MLSDESSSDSETGRFKGNVKKKQDEQKKDTHKDDRFRSSGRKRFDDRHRNDSSRRRSRERSSRQSSSTGRRRHSRERSPRKRRSGDRHRSSRESRDIKHRQRERSRSATKEKRSKSKDRVRKSRSRSCKSPVYRRDLKDEILQIVAPKQSKVERAVERSSSPEFKGKKSVIYKPTPAEVQNKKVVSPMVVVNLDEQANSDKSEEVQAGSYYSMIPAIVKEKSEDSSEIDSSDDERLRAKLLNLEKELHKSKKKKHKKRHRKKTSKTKDPEALVEVSSTTDVVQEKANEDLLICPHGTAEVSSTQKLNIKETSEEGEIISDDSQEQEIDPTDLRHKIIRSRPHCDPKGSPDLRERLKINPNVCGPALPPHLEKQYNRSSSPDVEGPALPPHLQKKAKNIGPSIPEDMRKVLAEAEHEIVESSEEDTGIGPVPVGAEEKWSSAHLQLEERALEMKMRKMDGHSLHDLKLKSREKWMLELPEGKAKYLGLEARSFRAKEGPDMSDRSSWTDTPEEKARKAAGEIKEDSGTALQREARARQIANRDDEQESAVKKHKKKHKRDESLLDMHQKKIKKKKKKDDKDEKTERRPFSRDVDLQVNRFDEAQKKSIIKKAQNLDSRFSRGEAKYL